MRTPKDKARNTTDYAINIYDTTEDWIMLGDAVIRTSEIEAVEWGNDDIDFAPNIEVSTKAGNIYEASFDFEEDRFYVLECILASIGCGDLRNMGD